jgi:hypothetical protein
LPRWCTSQGNTKVAVVGSPAIIRMPVDESHFIKNRAAIDAGDNNPRILFTVRGKSGEHFD